MDIRVFMDIRLQLSILLWIHPFGNPWISVDIRALTCYGFSIQETHGRHVETRFPDRNTLGLSWRLHSRLSPFQGLLWTCQVCVVQDFCWHRHSRGGSSAALTKYSRSGFRDFSSRPSRAKSFDLSLFACLLFYFILQSFFHAISALQNSPDILVRTSPALKSFIRKWLKWCQARRS